MNMYILVSKRILVNCYTLATVYVSESYIPTPVTYLPTSNEN